MNGTLCRCMSYYRVQMAVKRAAETLAEISPASKKEVVA
jgi:aerobic-type carbon monoxide dehydrogenase small subunit (CoxS/CutS family)